MAGANSPLLLKDVVSNSPLLLKDVVSNSPLLLKDVVSNSPLLLKDVVRKKKELLCPECRAPVIVDINFLPPNILVNRILEVSHCGHQLSSPQYPGQQDP